MAVFVALLFPHRAFEAVNARPRALLRLLLVCALAAVPAFAFVARVDLDRFAERTLSARGALEKVDEKERPSTIETTARTLRIALPAGAVAKRAGWILLVALLGFALLKGAAPELKLGPTIAAVAVASAPLLLSDLGRLLLILARDPLWIDLQSPLASNPAALWAPESPIVSAVLSALDLFRLWTVWLSTLALAAVSAKKGWLPRLAPLGLYAVSVLADVVGAAMRP